MLKYTNNTCILEIPPTLNLKVVFKYFPMISCATQTTPNTTVWLSQSDHMVYVWVFILKKNFLKVVVAPPPYGRLTDPTLLPVHVVTKTHFHEQ